MPACATSASSSVQELASPRAPGEYHAGFQEADRREQTMIGDDLRKVVRFGLTAEDRDQRRAADDNHTGRPFSP